MIWCSPWFVVFLPCLTLLFIATAAQADADDTMNLTAGLNAQYIDNLFFLSPSIDPETVLGTSTKSDLISTASAGITLNKRYSLQRFELEGTVVDTRYRTFDYLDFTALNYAAAWRWNVTPSFHGSLTSSRKESLNSFADYKRYNQRNIRTDYIHGFDATYEVDGAWRVLGGVSQVTRTNSELFLQEDNTRTNSVNGGIRYDFRSGSTLSLQSRLGHGVYTERAEPVLIGLLDDGYDEFENGAQLFWKITGKSSLNARLAYLDHVSANFSARDYAGTIGNMDLSWEVSAKVSLTAKLARQLSSYQALSSSYTEADRYTLGAYWRLSEKAGLRLGYDYERRNYLGAIAETALNGRRDGTRTSSLSLDWQPLRTVTITTSLQNIERSSNQALNDYEANVANISAQVFF